MTWRFVRRKLDLIFTDWRRWWREVSSRKFEIRILAPELEIMKAAPWSRIREQNSVYKEFLEIVGNGKPTGSVWKERIAVSGTIWISVQNRHSLNLLRDLLRGRMRKMHREPEVLEAEAQVGKWLDYRARITSKELAPLHPVKNGILQNACSTSQKMDADLGKSALVRVNRLMNSLAKRSKKCWQKCSGYVQNYTTIGLRISRYGAAEVFIDVAEELKLSETDPMCSIHWSRGTSC